jgi:hypothetical protein
MYITLVEIKKHHIYLTAKKIKLNVVAHFYFQSHGVHKDQAHAWSMAYHPMGTTNQADTEE